MTSPKGKEPLNPPTLTLPTPSPSNRLKKSPREAPSMPPPMNQEDQEADVNARSPKQNGIREKQHLDTSRAPSKQVLSTPNGHHLMTSTKNGKTSTVSATMPKLPENVKRMAQKLEQEEKNTTNNSLGTRKLSSKKGSTGNLLSAVPPPTGASTKSLSSESSGSTTSSRSVFSMLQLVFRFIFVLPILIFRRFLRFMIDTSQTLTNPERKSAALWVSLLMLISLYNFVGVTFRCSFLYLFNFTWYSRPQWISMFAAIDAVCDLIWFYDILLGFVKPYTGDDGLLVFDTRKTARHYLSPRKGWFWLDFLTVIPADWILIAFWPRLVPFFRINRALRLVLKFLNFFSYFENYLNISSNIIRIFKFILVVLLMTHVVTCCWYIVSISEEPQNTIMWTNIEDMPFRPIGSIYLYAFHWCLTTMIGYGGTVPASLNQVIYSEFVVCVGVALFVTVIGTLGSLVTNLDSNASKNRQRLDEIKEYMKYRKIPNYLSNKIVNYYTFLFKSRKGWDEEKILNDLPQYLRMEVALDMNRKIVEKVELFKNSSRMFISSVVLSLMPRMTLPGAAIVRRGEIGREMYFIASGVVHILSPKDDKTIIVKLGEGSFFGEIAVIYDSLRSCTVRAGTYCDLYVLTKEAFERIEQDYPDQVRRIRELADKRKEVQEKQKKAQQQKEEEDRLKQEQEMKQQVENELGSADGEEGSDDDED